MSKQGTLLTVPANQNGALPKLVTRYDPLPIHIISTQHNHFNEIFHTENGVSSTLAAASAAGDTSITVASGAGFTAGDVIDIGTSDSTHVQITAVAVNVLTLDRPLDHAHASGETVEVIDVDLSTTIGTLASPISYTAHPDAGFKWHIFTLLFAMVHATAGDDGKFGGIAELTNGVMLRVYHGDTDDFHTFANWKRNQDMLLDLSEMDYSDKAPSGKNGTHGHWNFNDVGVSIELNGDEGDYLELLVQDDITGLESLLMNVQGHYEVL